MKKSDSRQDKEAKVSHIYKHTQMSDCQQIVKMLISIRQNA